MHFRLSGVLRLTALALASFQLPLTTSAQRPPAQPDAAEILHRMQKLNVLGSVLYIVAHPDDENTRLIAWLANGKKVRTGNLSLTRGDGGQNLIGPELGDALGIIRTQELMEARRIDGGEQFFTRAVDFGYSKNAAESFEKWGKQEVLSDMVRVIRMFRPDVIITRFAPDRSAGHGHHEASAILAEEAFDLAGDPKAFPEQLQQGLEVWQPRRLFFNGSTWWKKDLADIAKNDPDWFSVDVGGYDPLLGLSYTEIAGRSRSMHKSQGFGAAETRGEMLEYLKLIKGDRPKTRDIFEGIDMTWGRVPDPAMEQRINAMISAYSTGSPESSAPALIAVHQALSERDKTLDANWLSKKQAAVEQLLLDVHGITMEALSQLPTVVVESQAKVDLHIVARRPCAATASTGAAPSTALEPNRSTTIPLTLKAPAEPDGPFWLELPHNDLYRFEDPKRIGVPALPVHFVVPCTLQFENGPRIIRSLPVMHRWVDRVKGELVRECHVIPSTSIYPKRTAFMAVKDTQKVDLGIEAFADLKDCIVHCEMPYGWKMDAMMQPIPDLREGDKVGASYRFIKDEGCEEGTLEASVQGASFTDRRTLRTITYDHLMPQVYSTPAKFKIVPLDAVTTAKRVGYVKGAGDDVPQAIQQLGVIVDFIEPASAKLEELKKYDAIVTGIRAYNATKGMKELHPLLLQYVEQGGTLIVQYNTSPRFSVSGVEDFQIDPATLGPHPFKITRDRVTVEEAPPTFLDPKHPLLTTPNAITAKDFEEWVQERGLYFAGEFGDKYTPLIAWNDPGEQPLNGGLITCDHGKGRFIYTGISFFRQLPAGVPGAYRLFANLISPRGGK
ncbi:MAG TPA: PIG-L family deacetylase [Flavobacteriales bacterium]|nr:PIG-L family deacetylase [Flavobacteriales bacterium]